MARSFSRSPSRFGRPAQNRKRPPRPLAHPSRLVPLSPTPRAPRGVATPMRASNLDAIIDEGTLTIGWCRPGAAGDSDCGFRLGRPRV